MIIPTRNRALFLYDALDSIARQTMESSLFEIIVCDNGSTDNTGEIVKNFRRKSEHRISYFCDHRPGLHIGRHLGALNAQGDILAYTDDDIIAHHSWLEAIVHEFKNPNVGLVGGKSLPQWEGDCPPWIELFRYKTDFGWTIAYLSLLDIGEDAKEIPPNYVFGCNFSIRRSILIDCGGFHPDGMPQELIHYRGDGETALATAVPRKGYKIIYTPKAIIYHRVPQERLTLEYFCGRAFNEGISASYAEIRRQHNLDNSTPKNRRKRWSELGKIFRPIKAFIKKKKQGNHPILLEVKKSFEEGKLYHQKKVTEDPQLLNYVLKENYF